MANYKIEIATVIVTILIMIGLYFLLKKEPQIIIPQIAEESNLGGLTYSVSGEELTENQYLVLKAELKSKIANRNKKLLNNKDVGDWTEIVNKELKNCQMKNVKDIILALNSCL